jgi:hypothetical protein
MSRLDDVVAPAAHRLVEDLDLAVTVREAGQPGYLYASRACEELIGRPRAQWPSDVDPFLAYSHPEDRDAVTEAHRLGPGEAPPPTVDWRLLGPDGAVSQLRTRWGWTSVNASQFLVSISHQLSAEPLTGQVPRDDEDARGRLSHDLRTPLNAVLGFAQLLALSELNQQQREELEEIAQAGRRLLALIDTFGATGSPA